MFLFGRIKAGIIEVQRFFKKDLIKYEGRSVEIQVLGNNRTTHQNNYLWGVIYKLVAEHTGFTSEEVHEVYKKKFLTYTKTRKGVQYKFTRSTTELNKTEFGEYLDKVINHAQQELQIIIPEPDIEYAE